MAVSKQEADRLHAALKAHHTATNAVLVYPGNVHLARKYVESLDELNTATESIRIGMQPDAVRTRVRGGLLG